MEQVLSDLQALQGLYGLLHKGQQANENMLSGPLMSPALERRLSIQPCRPSAGDSGQRLKPLASPSLSVHASEWSRRPKPQSPARSRQDYDDRRLRGRDDRLLARVASNRSARTTMPRLHPSTPEQRITRLGSHRSSRAAEQWSGDASSSASRVGRSDRYSRLRRGSRHGDRSSSPERSSRRRSVSRAPSTTRLLDRTTAREGGASSTSHRVGRLDTGLSRRGSERAAGRGAATSRWSSPSSDGEAVTIRSRIRPNRELLDRCVRRAEEIEELSLRRRGNKNGTVRSGISTGRSSRRPRRTLDRIDSGSTYSSGSSSSASASTPSPSMSATAPSTPGASASPCSSSSVSVSPRGGARLEYPFEEGSSASKSRRRRERQERREGRLRRFKNKLALVFHHRHDHHHHHHIGRSDSPLSRRDRRGKKSKSPWSYLGGMFQHRTAGQDGGKKKSTAGHDGGKKKSTSKTVVTAKRRGGHAPSLFDALVRHKFGGRKAPVRAGMVRTRSLSRVQVKKMNWWQQLRQRRGRAEGSSRPHRRLGQGKVL
ncbi:hypothetical protein ACQ4PT_063751 [Festuca glaucescens]